MFEVGAAIARTYSFDDAGQCAAQESDSSHASFLVGEALPDEAFGRLSLASRGAGRLRARHYAADGGRALVDAFQFGVDEFEDTVTGAMCSRMWHCRTYNRRELLRVCRECGLRWSRPLYFTRLHRIFRLGGIIVELVKQ